MGVRRGDGMNKLVDALSWVAMKCTQNKYLNAISSADNNVFVDIEVSPNSNKFQISGFNEWRNRFEIRIKQIPQKGKANKEIVKELSKIFNCNVGISKGEKSSQKTIVCYDVSIEYILDKLGEIL